VIIIDEYLLVRVVLGDWPEPLPDSEDLILPLSRHWRLLQRLHAPGGGQLTALLTPLSPSDRDAIRFPHPELVRVLDSRVILDEAAQIAAHWGGGWLIAETLAAGLNNGRALWFGHSDNVGRGLATAAGALGIDVHVV
jgi:hypothetical protein